VKKRSPFAKGKPLTPRQRKKGLVLPLSEKEAQVLRAVLGRTNDIEQRELLTKIAMYPGAIRAMDQGASTKNIFMRLASACYRRELAS
jgi:hypothetical protein